MEMPLETTIPQVTSEQAPKIKTIFGGLGQAIGGLFGVEPKPIDETLEEKINKALAEEREKIKPSREDIDTFSWITKDNNPMHRLEKRARKFGFEKTPLMGAHVAAYGEQYIERVVERMKEFWGAEIKIIGQNNKFNGALYPEEKILWKVNGYKQADDEIRLNLTGSTKERTLVEITSRLGKSYHLMPQIAGPIPNVSKRYLLEEEHLEEFYNCVGGKNEGGVPNMLAAAFVPPTLLNLLEEKTQSMEGENYAMEFEFLREPSLGMLQVDIFPPKKPKTKQIINKETKEPVIDPKTGQPVLNYIYWFRAVVSQDAKPITYGKIMSSTPYLMTF